MTITSTSSPTDVRSTTAAEAPPAALVCGVPDCGKLAAFHFAPADPAAPSAPRCWRHGVVYRPIVRRAVKVALVVGTILFFINQADVIFGGRATPLVVAKSLLTYLVPFSVSLYSALAANRV